MVLLVIDMQKILVDKELYNYDAFIKNMADLIDIARKNNVEIIYFQHDAGQNSGLSFTDKGFEIDKRFAPKENEKIFVKTINSCFGNKEFVKYINRKKDKRLIITGLQTNYCIDATIKSAFERGFEVFVPEGTNSTFDNDFMNKETTYRYYNEEIWPDLFANCVSLDEMFEMIKK